MLENLLDNEMDVHLHDNEYEPRQTHVSILQSQQDFYSQRGTVLSEARYSVKDLDYENGYLNDNLQIGTNICEDGTE